MVIFVPANVLLAEDKQELGHHGGDVPGGVGQQGHLVAGRMYNVHDLKTVLQLSVHVFCLPRQTVSWMTMNI